VVECVCVIITLLYRLRQEEQEALKLKKEVRQISDAALHLRSDLEAVTADKEKTLTAYQIEKKRRMNTERRLRLAEDSLKRLDKVKYNNYHY
jgi:hypothetical protein